VLANGKLIVIDGGMSEAYQPVTGIAGYTLIGNSHALVLAAHEAFKPVDEMLRVRSDVTPQTEQVAAFPHRVLIAHTDTGQSLRGQIADLQQLVDAYREGVLVDQARDARVRCENRI
jgi:fructose-1,6-bisphosphatase-3